MSNLKAIHQAMRLQPIDKLMVVGQHLSGYTSVERVLGMLQLFRQTVKHRKKKCLLPACVA